MSAAASRPILDPPLIQQDLLGRCRRALAALGWKLWQPLAAGPASRAQADLVSLVFSVCAALFLTKAILAALDLADPQMPPQIWNGDWLPSLAKIAACCAADLAAGLVCLLVAALALRLGTRPTYRAVVRAAVYLTALAALFLTVINAHLFHKMHCFLTWALIEAGGGVQMEASLADYAETPAFQLTAVLLPLVTLTCHLAVCQAFPRFWAGAAHWLTRPALLMLLSAGLLLGAASARSQLFGQERGDFADNPHLILVCSFFETSAVEAFAATDPSEASDLIEDFLPGRPQPSVGLFKRHPRNIVVLAVESFATPYLELYGGRFPNTPNLCRLQKKGIVFTNFYATGTKTIVSALPLFGSLYNDVRKNNGTAFEHEGFPVPNIAQWLKDQGYRTYFLTANGGTRGGWDTFLNIRETFTPPGTFDVGREDEHPFWRGQPGEGLDPRRIHKEDYLDAAMFADAQRVLRDAGGRKFFLMLWNYETHYPYYPGAGPAPFDERHYPKPVLAQADQKYDFTCYLKSIWRLDALIGDFYRDLEELGLAEDTLVVITGDHGEAWGQHGTWIHGGCVHEEEVHVPLILLWPGLAHLGPRCDVVGDHVSLWPTLMDVCGLPSDPRWQGRSLFGGKPDEPRRAYFHNYGSTMLGLREGKYKLILDLARKRDLLFDLSTDPEERTNLAEAHADYCNQQRRRLQAWVQYQTRLTRQRLEQAKAGAP
jgi:arylsulfatase A-like enzyme